MPNWCYNKIVIKGDKSKIKEILEKIGTIPNATKSVLFKTLIGDGLNSESRESNIEMYGTKWDVSPEEASVEFSDEQINMTPQTAWSPPVPFCISLAKDYGVNVTITYFEPGNDFAGKCEINEDGEITNEEDYEYNEGTFILDPDEFWNDRENDYLDEEDLDDKDLKSYVSKTFPYLDETCQIRLVTIYEKTLKDEDEDTGE
jgi:hypothetical protein